MIYVLTSDKTGRIMAEIVINPLLYYIEESCIRVGQTLNLRVLSSILGRLKSPLTKGD
jgi:hypothetical protein